jgi:hypothetical protein
MYGNLKGWCILGLLPSYLEKGDSSLVYMVDSFIKQDQHAQSGFYLYDLEKLHETLLSLERSNQKTLLIGVTYALLDFAEKFPISLANTIIMGTGGMKGRREEMRLFLFLFLAAASVASAAQPVDLTQLQCGNFIYSGNKSSVCFADKFLTDVARETNLQPAPRFCPVKLDADTLFDYPFCVMSGNESFALTARERERFRKYLMTGGFLLASPGCSDEKWDKSFRNELKLFFPEHSLQKIPLTHPIFSTVHKIPRLTDKHGKAVMLEGLELQGRLALIYSKEGLNDVANAKGCCCCGGNEISGIIANKLRENLAPAQKEEHLVKVTTRNITAYTYYLKGLHYWNKLTPQDFRRAIENFLAIDASQGPQMCREHDPYHGKVWTSTDNMAGRSRTIGVQLSPASAEPYTCPPDVPK